MEDLSAAVGQRVRELREDHGVTADDLAEFARVCGLRWQRSTVASIETGRRGLTAEELLLLPIVLTMACSTPITLRQLLQVEAALSGEIFMVPLGFEQLLDGSSLSQRGVAVPGLVRVPPPEYFDRLRRLAPNLMTSEQLALIEDDALREAERKGARKLGVYAVDLAAVAFDLWGHGLSTERDARVSRLVDEQAPPRSIQAMRGRVTRELLAELEPVLIERLENS